MNTRLQSALIFLLLFTGNAFAQTWTCGDTLVDPRDGKRYVTIPYGSDCWMAENLNYGQFVMSDSTSSFHSDMFNDGNVQKYCQGNDSMNCIHYGGLYEWNELMNYTTTNGGQGICPPGWHVATDAEWQAMIAASGGTFSTSTNRGTGANDMKDLGEGLGGDTGTNATGFAARAHGDRDAWGIFTGFHMRFIFWTSTPTSDKPYQYTLWAENDTIYRYNDAGTETGFSCRCVMNNASSGMNENNYEEIIVNAFPNPANDQLTIRTSHYTGTETFRVLNLLGEEMQSGKLSGTETTVSLTELPAGTYSVFIQQSNGNAAAARFVIVR